VPELITNLPNPILPEFWIRPAPKVEADLAELRAAPLAFMAEPEVPDGALIPQGPGSWMVTKHADILHMSKKPDIFSSAAGITVTDVPVEFLEFFSSMIAMDDPRHARLRRIVSAGFTPRMLAKLDETVQEVAANLVAELVDKREVDFVVDVAAALPLKIVCDLMGIDEKHYQFVFDRTNVILGAGDPEYLDESADIVTELLIAGGDLAGLMAEVAEAKKGGDGTDLTSMLVNAKLQDDQLTAADLGSFFILLVVAGNETTRNAISWGLQYLTENPDQRELWASDFEAYAPGAVEEIVRLAAPVTYMRRTATQDTMLGDQKIAAGEKLCMFYLAANRDEDVFEDPYKFDITRTPNNHVGFGGPGPHFCLGAHLARREITVMFRELFKQAPTLRATGEPDLLLASFIHGIKHLPAKI
jgi:cytochrome P450